MTLQDKQAQVRALSAELRRLRAEPYIEDKRAIWLDCPTCGTVPPKVEMGRYNLKPYAVSGGSRIEEGPTGEPYVLLKVLLLVCSGCGAKLPGRSVSLKQPKPGQGLKCDVRCLNAKGDECNCLSCLGACHSRGACTCQGER